MFVVQLISSEVSMDKVQKFKKWHSIAPFGLFVHWGVYALSAYHEQYLMRTSVSRADYEELYKQFNPTEFDPEQLVVMAKQAGMKYICFTAKHHDGFCMWDTKTTCYNIMNTPYNKDVLKMLQQSCVKHGIKLSIYYSIPDWHNVNAYNKRSTHQIPPRATDKPSMKQYKQYLLAQITELMTNYGTISTLFWDIPPRYRDKHVNDFVRKLQPDILINDRGFDKGDFATPERKVPKGGVFKTPTEACQSVGRQAWGYRSNEDYYTPAYLAKGICKVQAMGGNYLLNVGLMPSGAVPPQAQQIINSVGNWYVNVSEAFADTTAISLFLNKGIHSTTKNNVLYLCFTNGLETKGIVLDPITILPQSVTVLNNGCVPQISIDCIPNYYKRKDRAVKYLHIYDIDCSALSGQAVVIKMEFDKGIDIALLNNNKGEKGEARY